LRQDYTGGRGKKKKTDGLQNIDNMQGKNPEK